MDRSDLDRALLTADRFVNEPLSISLGPAEREQLLGRLGLFGVRLAVSLIRLGSTDTATALAAELMQRSGLPALRNLLATQFAARRDVLKARSALVALEALLHEHPVSQGPALAGAIERITASNHELAELQLLNLLRTGAVNVPPEEADAMERLLGGGGSGLHDRLGLPADSAGPNLRKALEEELGRWQLRAESPLSDRAVVEAARVVVRTCEGLMAELVLIDQTGSR
jgi:hypothetical protein